MNNDSPDQQAAPAHVSFPAADLPATVSGRYRHVSLTPWFVGVFVLAVVVGVVIPAWHQVADDGSRTKALSRAKQIGLALRLFSGDNDGIYPKDSVPTELHTPASSNAAFAVLLPTYTTSEQLFGNAFSAYQTHPPDNVIDIPYTGKPVKTLEPGENVYAYVMGLTDASNPSTPLVVDGTDGTGHYVTDPTKRGGMGNGEEAIVVRLDNTATLAKLVGPADARYIPLGGLATAVGGKPEDNLLEVSHFGSSARLLDPAIDTSERPKLE